MMTAIANRPATTPQARQVDVGQAFERFLGPARAYRSCRRIFDRNFHLPDLGDFSRFDEAVSVTEHHRYELRRIELMLPKLPPLDEMRQLQETFENAANQPADEPTSRLLLALLLDSFRAQPGENAATIRSAMLATLRLETDDFAGDGPDRVISTAALGWAVQKLIRTCKFPPSASEVADAASSAASCFRGAAGLMERRIKWREEAERLVAIGNRLPDYVPAPSPPPLHWRLNGLNEHGEIRW